MLVLTFILLLVFISIGLILCATTLRSVSLSTLNFFIWLAATFGVMPWSYLSSVPPTDSDARLGWDASFVWAVFFTISILTLLYCAIVNHLANRPPKRRRRRSRSENPVPVTTTPLPRSNSRASANNI
ncbi:MAG: hypothetical protein WCD79_10505 [Chthoniobacteraceae bacterium]